jgi:hypothetical protein
VWAQRPDHDLVAIDALPEETAIAAVTIAELAPGPHATSDDAERARRQDRLQWAAATLLVIEIHLLLNLPSQAAAAGQEGSRCAVFSHSS